MMKWFLMEHRSDAVGLASVPVKRSDGITQTFDTEDAAITAAKRRMSVASVSYTVEAIDCSPCPCYSGTYTIEAISPPTKLIPATEPQTTR
jgi:hypothetical protein